MKKVTKMTIDYLFLKMSAHYNAFLPKEQLPLDFMKSQYFEELKEKDEELIFNNLKRHIHSSNYPPTVADLVKEFKSDKYFIPDARETKERLALLEIPNQQVDKEFIRKTVQDTLEKIEEVRKNANKRDFNPFN